MGLGSSHCVLLMQGGGDSHPPYTRSVMWNSPNHQHEVAQRHLPAMRGNRGAIHGIPAGAEPVHSSAGFHLPGQPCHCLVGARLFSAVHLASPSPKQTDAYDLDHAIAAKLVT